VFTVTYSIARKSDVLLVVYLFYCSFLFRPRVPPLPRPTLLRRRPKSCSDFRWTMTSLLASLCYAACYQLAPNTSCDSAPTCPGSLGHRELPGPTTTPIKDGQ